MHAPSLCECIGLKLSHARSSQAHPMDMLAALALQGPTEEELAERAERQR